MKRFPAFDPPEYLNWQPDPDLVREFDAAWSRDPDRRAIVEGLSREQRLDLYAALLRTRLQDIMLKRWVRQGVISKAWLGTGEEATTVGPVHAIDRERDVVAPIIRNAGACREMGTPMADTLRGYLGTADSPSGGRDSHAAGMGHRLLHPIANLGNMPTVAVGIALSFKMRKAPTLVLTWIGDGAVKAGPTHEALNFAAVQKAPVIFIIQNNQVALGTRVTQHHLPKGFDDLHEAYGCAGWSFDGNNVLDAFAATRLAADACRSGRGPVILSAETFRMGGHATHDEAEARHTFPPELFERWGKRDPIGLYEEHLKHCGVTAEELEAVEAEAAAEVERAGAEALASKQAQVPAPASALGGVYAN